ncbi:MAG: hypothetical protein LBG44_07205 [Gemmatimonadota bacterium]|jgi:hypothetical protein|nr:hypothetical protein [Gemmatimonadota bacterium]
MGKPVKIGDVFELETNKGLAYIQYTHRNKLMGVLVRVLPGLYSDIPEDLSGIVEDHSLLRIFFPLQAAVNKNIVRLVANIPVPAGEIDFPVFRAPVKDLRNQEVVGWWLWDGESEWPIDRLSEEQMAYPVRTIVNDTKLIEDIIEVNGKHLHQQ